MIYSSIIAASVLNVVVVYAGPDEGILGTGAYIFRLKEVVVSGRWAKNQLEFQEVFFLFSRHCLL